MKALRRTAGWCRRHPVAVAALLYALLALAFVSPALLPGRTLSGSDLLWSVTPWESSRPDDVRVLGANPELSDAATQFQPWLQHTRSELPDAPLWNPHSMGGRPFLGNSQSAVFSLFSVPAYVLPFWSSLALIAALKLFLAGFGTFLLGRALGMRTAGALLAGVVFAFGLFMVVWLSWPLSSAWALLPWLLLLTDRLVRRPGALPAAGLAAVVGLELLTGHPESNFHVLFAMLAFFVLRLAMRRREGDLDRRCLARTAGGFGLAMVGGAGLAAVALAPFLELVLRSADLQQRAGVGAELPVKNAVTFFLPDFYGRPTGVGFTNALRPFFVYSLYAGGLSLMLAAAALIFRPSFERAAVAAFGLACLGVVYGIPPIAQIVNAIPGFHSANNLRLAILLLICVALLAGWGLDELVARRPTGARARAILAIAAVLLCVPLAWLVSAGPSPDSLWPALKVAWGFEQPPYSKEIVRLASLIVWLTVAGAAVALLTLRIRRGIAPSVFAALAVALMTLDLFRAGMGYNTAIDSADASQPATGAVRYLQSRRPARFAGTGITETPGLPSSLSPIPPGIAMRHGLYDVRGYDYPVERRFDRLWRRAVGAPPRKLPGPYEVPSVRERSLRALNLLSVADVITPADADLRAVGLRPAYRGSDAKVYANERALPRAFLVGSQRVVDGEDAALRAVVGGDTDLRRVALTERPLPGLRRARPGGEAGSASIDSYGDERQVVSVDAKRPSLLILTDVHYPGWKAAVDGRSAPIERVDYLLRGIPVPAGRHRVELRYEPASWRAGWIVSIVSLLALAAAVGIGMRRRRAGAA